jgi:hypothetical protein
VTPFAASHLFLSAYSHFSGDVSIPVQNPDMPHLVPRLFDGRNCSGQTGTAVFASFTPTFDCDSQHFKCLEMILTLSTPWAMFAG